MDRGEGDTREKRMTITPRALAPLAAAAYVLIALSPATAWGTTWGEVTVTCPICQHEVTEFVANSTYGPKRSHDFRPYGGGVDMATARLVMCARCGFAAMVDRFEETEGLAKDKVRKALAQLKSPALFQKLDRAIVVERNWTNAPHRIAYWSLAAKWTADDTGEPAVIRKRIADAIDAYKVYLTSEKGVDESPGTVPYLVGELYRQAGDREQAIAWFSKAEKLIQASGREQDLPWFSKADNKWMARLLQQQMFLARHGDTPPADVLTKVITAGKDGEKLAAIRFLRDSDDPAVLAFLKEFCLNGPDDLRRPAMKALLGRAPRKEHLPIFLAGLRNKHFRTVQGCARGVESLKAAQAAPVIVEALKSPVQATEGRLLAALAVVATEKELAYLISQVDDRDRSYSIFEALLNTRSPKAIPYIHQMLRKDRMDAWALGGAPLQNAAAMGPALLDALPDPGRRGGDSDIAIFKVRVLGEMQGPETEKTLIAALKWGGDAATHAALALARRGSDVAKPAMLERVGSVRYHDKACEEYLYPLLEPSDYGALYRRMQKERADHKAYLDKRRARHRSVLEDDERDAEEKEVAEYYLRQLKREEEGFIQDWLPLLGATGSPKGRSVYLTSLDSSRREVRAEAAKALGGIYDDAIGDILAGRLGSESPTVAEQIIATIGKATDRRHVDALMSYVRAPSFVSTKLVWIDAMAVLAPDKAAPLLREWVNSPNADLAEACRKALSAQREQLQKPKDR